ncbi:MAG TPA: NAD-dependent succinate-semialdehyde dehydrogenase, partial [Streptosporangiaceae bacterium]|nr:NAD-dependent succinate-semialdehyde dehydrogenase [Streptosporangiaceae bacterium]
MADGTEQDALDAVGAAQSALAGWAATPPRQRAECLRRTFELMTSRAESLARLMVAENGKALRDARAEATYSAEFFRWYAEEAVRMEGVLMQAPSGANKILVMRQPVGVSVLVTPWNFPAAMATRKIGPALAAGCTVVLKPASETPLTALYIAELLAEAGVPDGVVNVLPSRKSGAVVSAMLNDPRVRKLSFTGSTEVGRILLREAADTVVNTSMELGGNAPFIIFEDADVDAAIEGALIAKMRNGGEACTAANRFYVHEAVADEFSRKFAARLDAMKVGPGLDEGTDVGPLVNEPTRSKVAELVESAAADGGKVVTGGRAPDRRGYFYQPTVIDQVPSRAGILGTEIFGPVAPVVRFTAEDDAVRWANDTEFGHLGPGRLVDQRPYVGALVQARPDLHGVQAGGELAAELVGDRLVHVEAVGGGARLTAVAHLGDQRPLHGGVDVRVLEDDEGRVAAQLHRGVHHGVGRFAQQDPAHLGGAGERQLADPGVVQHRRDNRARLARGQHVDHAVGHARLGQQASDGQRGQRGLRGRLEHDRAAGRQRRADLAGGHRGREVPRRDQHRDAHRLAHDQDLVRPGRRLHQHAFHPHRLFGVPAEELGRVGCLGPRVTQRLAVLGGHQLREGLGMLGHQLEGPAQAFRALPRRGRGPAGQRALGRADRVQRVLDGAVRDLHERVLGGGVDDAERAAVPSADPLTADQQ